MTPFPLSLLSRAMLLAVVSTPLYATEQPAADAAGAMEVIVVTAAGYAQELREAPASITVLTGEELSKKHVASIADALSDVEGIDVGNNAGKTGGLNISIRGMPSDYTLILIDGRRQNSAGNVTPNGFGETSTSFMPPISAIDRIEIIRGPMSTLYGSDAMGGVVNIITKKVGTSWGGAATLENTLQQENAFGNNRSASLYLNGPLLNDKLGLVLRAKAYQRDSASISYRNVDGQEVELGKMAMGENPVKADILTTGAKLNYQLLQNQVLTLDLDNTAQKYDNSKGQLGTLGTGGYLPEQKYLRQQASLGYQADFDSGNLDLSLMQNNTETKGRLIPPGVKGAGQPRLLEAENTVFDAKWGGQLADHHFTLGGQWWDAQMTDGVATESFAQTSWALFAEDSWQLLTDLNLTVGLRRDDHDTFGGHTSPRAYLVWNTNDNWTIKGGLSQGYKTPRLDQLASGIVGFGAQGTLPLLGSPGLKPETSTTSEVAAFYDNNNGWNFSVGLFNNKFDDKIASGPGVPNCTFTGAPNRPGCVNVGSFPKVELYSQSINIDQAMTRGVELSNQLELTADIKWMLNYTYTDSEQQSGKDKGKPLSNTPKHMVNTSLNWQLNDDLTTFIKAEYRSDRYRSTTLAGNNTAEFKALGDYKGYSLLQLGLGYQLLPELKLNAAIYNLLNKDFLEYTAYAAPVAGNPNAVGYSNVYNNNQEGRRLWLGLSYEF